MSSPQSCADSYLQYLGNRAALPRLLEPEISETERVILYFFFLTEQHTRLIFIFHHAMKLI